MGMPVGTPVGVDVGVLVGCDVGTAALAYDQVVSRSTKMRQIVFMHIILKNVK